MRAKKDTMKKKRGLDSVRYQLLWDYLETELTFNLDTKLMVKMKEHVELPTFDMLYYS